MYLPITSIVHPFSSSSVVLVLDLDGVWQWEPKHMFRSVKSFYMHTSRFYLLTLRVSDGERLDGKKILSSVQGALRSRSCSIFYTSSRRLLPLDWASNWLVGTVFSRDVFLFISLANQATYPTVGEGGFEG